MSYEDGTVIIQLLHKRWDRWLPQTIYIRQNEHFYIWQDARRAMQLVILI